MEGQVPIQNNCNKDKMVQWLDKTTNKYVKFDRTTGVSISSKVTDGPYKNILIVKRKPHIRATKSAAPVDNKKEVLVRRVRKKAAPKVRKPRKVNYLNNKDLMKQVLLSKEQEKMTDRLAHMLQTLAARYGRRGNFRDYTYNEDMQAYAMMMLVRTWNSFKPEKSNNPFAFFTQCIKNSFIQFLNLERTQRNVRDALLVDNGLDPSHTFMDAYAVEQKKKNNGRPLAPISIKKQ